jgi:hypothetical protein
VSGCNVKRNLENFGDMIWRKDELDVNGCELSREKVVIFVLKGSLKSICVVILNMKKDHKRFKTKTSGLNVSVKDLSKPKLESFRWTKLLWAVLPLAVILVVVLLVGVVTLRSSGGISDVVWVNVMWRET